MDIRIQVYGVLDFGFWLCFISICTAMSLFPEGRSVWAMAAVTNRKHGSPRRLGVDESRSCAFRKSIKRRKPEITVEYTTPLSASKLCFTYNCLHIYKLTARHSP